MAPPSDDLAQATQAWRRCGQGRTVAKNLAALSAACERLGLDRCPADAEAVLLWGLENRIDGGRTLGELSPQRAEDAARQFLGVHLVGEYRAREQAG